MDFQQNFLGESILGPVIDDCEGVITAYVARQPLWNQARIAGFRPSSVIGMSWQQKPLQSASLIVSPANNAGRNLPVNVFALPGAWANQNDGHGGVRDVIVADSAAYFVPMQTLVVNVSLTDGLINELAVQGLNEPVLVLLIVLVIVADGYFVLGNLVHGRDPALQ